MPTSQNGWSANDRSKVSSRPVPGTSIRLTVRTGPAGDLLLEVASLFDQLVQDIDNGRGALDDWGYAERPIRGATALSNHASGTAIDLNATRWSLGQPASVNLNRTQIARTREIVAATGGVVRWGGDYTGRKDPMHFEINNSRSEADCVRALDALRRRYGSRSDLTAPRPPVPPAPLSREDDPMVNVPIRTDAHGRFHEACMVEAGNGSRYGTQASVTLGTTWGGAQVKVTALDHRSTPLYSWTYTLTDNGFAGLDLPDGTRIVTVEGAIDHPVDQIDEAGNITQPATRLAAAVHTKAAA